MITSLVDYLESSGQRSAESTAIIDGPTRLTFGKWRSRSRATANRIIQHAPGESNRPVAVILPKGADALVAFLGVLYSGNFYVPLDVRSPSARLQKILEDLDPLLVVSATEHAAALRDAGVDDAIVVMIDLITGDQPLDEQTIDRRCQAVIDTDPCYVKYTSGSTGDPKGVVLPHRAVIDYIECAQEIYQLGGADVIANQAPLTFDVSVQDIYLCLKTGASLVLVPEQHFVFPANLVSLLAEQEVTFFCWVPSVLVNVSNLDLLAKADTSNLKWVTVLGEVMPTKHFNYWAAHCPQATLVNTYGPTETAIASTYYVLDREFADTESLPIGVPYRNTAVVLLDENDEPATAGSQGEICIRGSSLALGYWNARDKTETAFAATPVHSHYPERVYRTGDLGYLNERGELMFLGRKDSQVKHLGYRIELGEIETAAAAVPGVDQACVMYDQDRSQIILFYRASDELDRARWRKTLANALPNYMIPRVFRRVSDFPLNPNGKVDRKQLYDQYYDTDA